MRKDGFVSNNGVRIYYEVEGGGPPLLLHHGFTGSGQRWREFGYLPALVGRFSTVLIDARGHGKSGKPHDPEANTMELRVEDVRRVLDDLGYERAHLWGYSMGGRTAYAFAARHPERLTSVVIGGASPYVTPASVETFRRWAELIAAGDSESYAQELGQPPEVAEQILAANDPMALRATQLGMNMWPGVDPSQIATPALLYVGSEDSLHPAVQKAASEMPGARFELIDGLDHLGVFANPDLTLPVVNDFLAMVEAGARV